MNRQNTRPIQTPEQLEYEELTKKMRLTTAKLRIAQEGIDVSSLSQQSLDKIMRIFDEMEHIQRDNQQKTSKIQQEANMQTQKVNQDTGKKFGEVQKKYQDLIKSLKEEKKEGHVQLEQIQEQVVQVQPVAEEVREKTHEEKVSEITDIVLKAMRDSVYERIDEIMRTVDTKAEATVGRKDVLATEETDDNTKQTTVESAIIGSEDRPDDKDIPVITPEMEKMTTEEISRRRGEHRDIGRIE